MAGVTDDAALQFPILIGDIGGTNARFAILRRRASRRRSNSPTCTRPTIATIDDAIRAAITRGDDGEAALGRARRRRPGRWRRDPAHQLPLGRASRAACSPRPASRDVVVLNDFEAQALAVVALGEEHMEKIGGGDAGSRRRPRRARPRHRARRRRPDPRLRPLDPGARRRRPHGHRPAHAARFRDLPASRDDRGPHFGRADPVRPRPRQRLSRGRQGRRRRRRASRRRPRSPVRRLARPMPVAEEALSLFVTCLGAHRRRPRAGVQEPRRRLPDRRHRAENRAGAASAPNFRAAFEDKAPHSALMRSMPVYVITHPLAALAGLAALRASPTPSASKPGDGAGRRNNATWPAYSRAGHRQIRALRLIEAATGRPRGRPDWQGLTDRAVEIPQSTKRPGRDPGEIIAVVRRVLAENGREYLPQYLFAIGCLLAIAATTAFSAWIMRDVVDEIFYQPPRRPDRLSSAAPSSSPS